MDVDEARIRDCCTEAVFDRGRSYREEGRVGSPRRFGGVVTATVRGSRPYDVTCHPTEPGFDAACTCPYAGPGECKHVVAVLLDVARAPPTDERDRVEDVIGDVPSGELRSFVTDELARNAGTRDRFLARFGDGPGRSVEAYRAEVDRLFAERTTDDPVVVEAIDFSRLTDLADRCRAYGHRREAAAVHRALAEGIEAHGRLVDAAHEHYRESFEAAVDGYVECVRAAALGDEEYGERVGFLADRAAEATGYPAERYAAAVETLRAARG